MGKAFELTFSKGLAAHAVQVHSLAELSIALRELGLRRSNPALVLVGGAGGLSDAELGLLRPLFMEEMLAPLAEALGQGVYGVKRKPRLETRASIAHQATATPVPSPPFAWPKPS